MSDLNSAPRRGQMMEIHCPSCGRIVCTYVAGDYRYGSPLKNCPKCSSEYINPAVHEIEVDGISPDAFDMKKLILGMIMGVVFFIIGAVIFHLEVTRKGYYHTSNIAIMVISVIAFFYALGNIVFIKTGIKAKWTERKRQESVSRMSDPEYALRLKAHGYNVPEKYLPKEYSEKN